MYLCTSCTATSAELLRSPAMAGLQQLGIHVIVGNPDVRLSCKWAAFEQLTSLTLSGLNSLRQGVGPCGEVLHCLFQHLQYARIEVGACQGLRACSSLPGTIPKG